MKEGHYVADEYTIILNGTPNRGRFDEMRTDPIISGLDEDSISAMEVCSEMAYRFEGGEWDKTLNGRKISPKAPAKNYRIDGEKIILFNAHGKPESTTLLLRDDAIEERLGKVLSIHYRKK